MQSPRRGDFLSSLLGLDLNLHADTGESEEVQGRLVTAGRQVAVDLMSDTLSTLGVVTSVFETSNGARVALNRDASAEMYESARSMTRQARVEHYQSAGVTGDKLGALVDMDMATWELARDRVMEWIGGGDRDVLLTTTTVDGNALEFGQTEGHWWHGMGPGGMRVNPFTWYTVDAHGQTQQALIDLAPGGSPAAMQAQSPLMILGIHEAMHSMGPLTSGYITDGGAFDDAGQWCPPPAGSSPAGGTNAEWQTQYLTNRVATVLDRAVRLNGGIEQCPDTGVEGYVITELAGAGVVHTSAGQVMLPGRQALRSGLAQ